MFGCGLLECFALHLHEIQNAQTVKDERHLVHCVRPQNLFAQCSKVSSENGPHFVEQTKHIATQPFSLYFSVCMHYSPLFALMLRSFSSNNFKYFISNCVLNIPKTGKNIVCYCKINRKQHCYRENILFFLSLISATKAE